MMKVIHVLGFLASLVLSSTELIGFPTSEFDALNDLYVSTDGPHWLWRDNTEKFGNVWNFTGLHNPCTEQWQGLNCTEINNINYITKIDLEAYLMFGEIPQSLGNFSQLRTLNFDYNLLYGTIPETICKLSLLQYLLINNNHLVGQIPDIIGNLTLLIEVDLSVNQLSGTIPHGLGSLPHLQNVFLNYNEMKGIIPNELGNATLLQNLFLYSNYLTSTIPQSFQNLTNLIALGINTNYLTGSIPTLFGNMTSLYDLQLYENLLTGSIPTQVGLLTSLIYLDLYTNNLNGTIPNELGSCHLLSSIQLQNNELSGSLPSVLSTLPIEYLQVSDNQLTGTLPMNILNNPKLIELEVFNNYMTGSLPTLNISTSQLNNLELYNNYFSGTVPSMINATQLGNFDVYNNSLTGPLPQFGNTFGLSIYIENNQFSGSLSEVLCSNKLVQFAASSNQFVGSIPDCFGDNILIENLLIDHNYLTSTLPQSLTNLTVLSELFANHNYLSGSISFITSLQLLQTVYLQNNFFIGQIQMPVINASVGMAFADFSNNIFTGQLNNDLFKAILTMQSFAAASNCLEGSIPKEICDLNNLIFLDLDGLSTVKSCRHNIFPDVSFINTFTLKNQLIGGVPECLFRMPTLETLHLSGNQLEWSFPNSLTVASSLQDLSLSHNKLTGTIPSAILSHNWYNLDLSYNRLTGVINSNISTTNSSITLQVNRLSGHVPTALFEAENVDILNGNLFDCGLESKQLPRYDPDYRKYQCGSDSFEQAVIVWSVFMGLVLMAIVFVWTVYRYKHSFQSDNYYVTKLFTTVDLIAKYLSSIRDDTSQLKPFTELLSLFRRTVLMLAMLICVIGLPLYATLTVYFRTLKYEYAWIVSAAYLSGLTPAMILLVVYTALIAFLFIVWIKWYRQQGIQTAAVPISSDMQWTSRSFYLLIVRFLNACVMIVVNGCYVYIILNYNTHVILATQIGVACLKLVWNDFAVRYMIRFTRYMSGFGQATDYTANVTAEMPTMTSIVLFNTIIAPCLATACVDPSCFVNAFIQPPAVTSTFPNFACSALSLQDCRVTNGDSLLVTSYDPPFIYNYQCTSAILTNYASVYVYMFSIAAFIKPVMLIIVDKFYKEVPRGSILHILLDNTIYNLLKNVQQIRAHDVLFKKERFVLRLISKLAVFLTFGVVFPPIAAVLCVAFYSETYLNEIILGRFLVSITDNDQQTQFLSRLGRDSVGTQELLLVPLIELVIPFSAMFYAFFIFDTYGDQVGWKGALLPAVFMASVPLFLYIGFTIHSRYSQCSSRKLVGVKEKLERNQSTDQRIELNDVKMTTYEDKNDHENFVVVENILLRG